MRELLLIDGAWRAPASGRFLAVEDPATAEPFAEVAAGGAEDVDAAVAAARHAFDEGPWPRMAAAERGAVLRRAAGLIRQRADEIARLEVRDNGKPLPEAAWDVADAAFCFEYFAALAETEEAGGEEAIDVGDVRFRVGARTMPAGVVGAITPWNYPLLMACWKVAPALAAGCTIVLKPSELCSLSCAELGRVLTTAGLPAGAFNLVTGFGAEAGAALAAHPGVDKLAFTGSVVTGSSVMTQAAKGPRRVSLELGGKSPFVVFADADLDEAVEWIMFGIFWNQGQVCSATSRLLVERAAYAPLLDRLAAAAQAIPIGPGLEPGVKLGPLVSAGQHRKVADAVARGVAEGGRLVTGGGRPGNLERGHFLEPTILADQPCESLAWREEIFGPVLCARPFDDEEEAIRLANGSAYGLAAAVMSADPARAERVAAAFRAGVVWVNCSQPTFVQAPWGGMKASGIGRELGRWGYEAFRETKQVCRWDADEAWGWYGASHGLS